MTNDYSHFAQELCGRLITSPSTLDNESRRIGTGSRLGLDAHLVLILGWIHCLRCLSSCTIISKPRELSVSIYGDAKTFRGMTDLQDMKHGCVVDFAVGNRVFYNDSIHETRL